MAPERRQQAEVLCVLGTSRESLGRLEVIEAGHRHVDAGRQLDVFTTRPEIVEGDPSAINGRNETSDQDVDVLSVFEDIATTSRASAGEYSGRDPAIPARR